MSGRLSPLKGDALHAARCAERKRIMEERVTRLSRRHPLKHTQQQQTNKYETYQTTKRNMD